MNAGSRFGAIGFREMNAEQLGIPAGFDRVLCSLGLMHAGPRGRWRVARVLRGGAPSPPSGARRRPSDGAARTTCAGEPLSVDYNYILRLGSRETRRLFRQAGFADVSVEQIGAPTVFADAGAFEQLSADQRPLQPRRRAVAEAAPPGRFIERAGGIATAT
jgi:hypothetical protein